MKSSQRGLHREMAMRRDERMKAMFGVLQASKTSARSESRRDEKGEESEGGGSMCTQQLMCEGVLEWVGLGRARRGEARTRL